MEFATEIAASIQNLAKNYLFTCETESGNKVTRKFKKTDWNLKSKVKMVLGFINDLSKASPN